MGTKRETDNTKKSTVTQRWPVFRLEGSLMNTFRKFKNKIWILGPELETININQKRNSQT